MKVANKPRLQWLFWTFSLLALTHCGSGVDLVERGDVVRAGNTIEQGGTSGGSSRAGSNPNALTPSVSMAYTCNAAVDIAAWDGLRDPGYEMAIPYRPTVEEWISKVELVLQRVGTPTGNVTLEVRTTSANLPTSTVVTTSANEIDAASVTGALGGTFSSFNLSQTAVLSANTTYAFVLKGGTGYAATASAYIRPVGETVGTLHCDSKVLDALYSTSAGSWSDAIMIDGALVRLTGLMF